MNLFVLFHINNMMYQIPSVKDTKMKFAPIFPGVIVFIHPLYNPTSCHIHPKFYHQAHPLTDYHPFLPISLGQHYEADESHLQENSFCPRIYVSD